MTDIYEQLKQNHNKFERCRKGTRERWEFISGLVKGQTVLDIGCAHGDGCEFVSKILIILE